MDTIIDGQVSIVLVGAGNRAKTYAEYAIRYPKRLKIVGVVEPISFRRECIAKRFSLPESSCFIDYTHFFEHPKMADAVLISTSDDLHYQPTIAAIDKGYHVLLEKPIAQSVEECREIAQRARRAGVVVGVCHVLRYHPTFLKIKELLDNNALGRLMSMEHEEAIGIERMTHAYVRGIWRRGADSNPIILSKSCHDIDLISWLLGERCRTIFSSGSLTWFRRENAPEQSADRCLDCRIEQKCPYSAVDLYLRRKSWLRHFDIKDNDEVQQIVEELRHGLYGRCVYHCDNDVADHQSVLMELENGVTVNFMLNGITKKSMRKTHIIGSMGELMGDEFQFTLYDHSSGTTQVFDFTKEAVEPFHAGADLALIADFVTAVLNPNYDFRVSIEKSLESHSIAFAAEQSRLTSQVVREY